MFSCEANTSRLVASYTRQIANASTFHSATTALLIKSYETQLAAATAGAGAREALLNATADAQLQSLTAFCLGNVTDVRGPPNPALG